MASVTLNKLSQLPGPNQLAGRNILVLFDRGAERGKGVLGAVHGCCTRGAVHGAFNAVQCGGHVTAEGTMTGTSALATLLCKRSSNKQVGSLQPTIRCPHRQSRAAVPRAVPAAVADQLAPAASSAPPLADPSSARPPVSVSPSGLRVCVGVRLPHCDLCVCCSTPAGPRLARWHYSIL